MLAYACLPFSNTLTRCVVVLLRLVNAFHRKELGRRMGRRSSLMKLTPPAQANTMEVVGNIILCLLEPFSSQVALLGFLIRQQILILITFTN